MEITVTDKEVRVTWSRWTFVSDVDIVVEMFKNADERERRRLAVIHALPDDSQLFRAVEERKPKRTGGDSHLTTEQICDIGKYVCGGYENDFEEIDNPHWIVE